MTGYAEQVPEPPVSADVEARIQGLFVRVLNIRVSSVDEDIIESGLLDSLGLIELLSELERDFGVVVDLAELEIADFRTVRSIAELVRRAEQTPR
jgi:acyl carrier protein